MKHINTRLGVIIAVLTIGIFAVAMANDGNGTTYGDHMMGHGMMGYGMGYHGHMMDYGYHGYGNLSSEDAAKFKELQDEFLKETEDLRNSIQEKQLALNQELEAISPDESTAADLQRELSKLESELDQKVLEHRLELKKTFPDTDFAKYGHGDYCWR